MGMRTLGVVKQSRRTSLAVPRLGRSIQLPYNRVWVVVQFGAGLPSGAKALSIRGTHRRGDPGLKSWATSRALQGRCNCEAEPLSRQMQTATLPFAVSGANCEAGKAGFSPEIAKLKLDGPVEASTSRHPAGPYRNCPLSAVSRRKTFLSSGASHEGTSFCPAVMACCVLFRCIGSVCPTFRCGAGSGQV